MWEDIMTEAAGRMLILEFRKFRSPLLLYRNRPGLHQWLKHQMSVSSLWQPQNIYTQAAHSITIFLTKKTSLFVEQLSCSCARSGSMNPPQEQAWMWVSAGVYPFACMYRTGEFRTFLWHVDCRISMRAYCWQKREANLQPSNSLPWPCLSIWD